MAHRTVNLLKKGGATSKWVRIVRQDPCTYCGGEGGTCDHITPRMRGHWPSPLLPTGFTPDHWTNLIGACAACNQRRGALGLLPFLIKERSDARTN